MEYCFNVFKKFLLFRIVLYVLYFFKCLFGLDVFGVIKVWFGLVFIVIFGCFIFYWVVFDFVKGFNILVDFIECFFLGVFVLCFWKFFCDILLEGLLFLMLVLYCLVVVWEEVCVWVFFVGFIIIYNMKKFFLKFSEIWFFDLFFFFSFLVFLR